MTKKILFFAFLIFTTVLFSQGQKTDSYKYIIVPEKFDFVKKVDEYQTSSLTKFLFKKKGFEVFLSNETLPSKLANNRCLSLVADVIDKSNMVTIKTLIELKDCQNKVVYTSKIGRSKNKNYTKGFHEAIRTAFDSMSDFEYSYQPETTKKEAVEIVVERIPPPPVIKPAPKQVETSKKTEIAAQNNQKSPVKIVYAQKVINGFQVVDTTPSVVFQLLETSKKNYFILQIKKGVLYKEGNFWVAEYYVNNQLISKKYEIKF